jgi:hypothetical protein
VQPEEKNVQEPPKEEYTTPELIVHGSVEEITEKQTEGTGASIDL